VYEYDSRAATLVRAGASIISAISASGERTDMEISIIGSIRTPFGEVELIPQDRNLLQASSIEPLQFRGVTIHLWAILERMQGTWGISCVVEPLLHQIDGSGHTSSFAGEAIAAELMKSVTLMAGEWAIAHPEAFECASAQAFKFDREGLYRELEALRESLTCSAQAIESISSEAPPEYSARLREFSQRMRSVAFDVPAMQEITQGVSYRGEDPSLPNGLPHSSSRGAPAANTKAHQLWKATGSRKNLHKPFTAGTPVYGQKSLSTNQLTLGELLEKQRKESGLS
jgi:hypothetical protein